jgi:iron complex outermembrane recepter protein
MDTRLAYATGLYYSNEENPIYSATQVLELLPIIPVTTALYDAVIRSRQLAGYGQGTYDLSGVTGIQGLGFTAGGRYTSERVSVEQQPDSVLFDYPVSGASNFLQKTFGKISWQVGVQEQLNSELLLYIASRHSFKSGGFNNFTPPFPGAAAVGGSEFLPELATDIEIGSKFQGRAVRAFD